MPYILTKPGSLVQSEELLANGNASVKAHKVIVWVEKDVKQSKKMQMVATKFFFHCLMNLNNPKHNQSDIIYNADDTIY